MADLRIELLGGFRVTAGGRAIPEDVWRRRKTAALIKLLALAPRHRLHREQVMDALWPDLSPEAGGANLRKATHYARRALGRHDAVSTEGEMVALFPGAGVDVDADRFEEAARAA